ncbi:NAD(P)/FAD-dependent oxidoreductase [Kribbella capetownensis]|uniref:NAD(P)/FAD-dependent oxidoreductase n=1 Tax=Kribbella capetownensis TaxID=1572659 RepID=A0A4R0JIB9_9ACTN|nr:NAD(P)/FAD-dependent oxidoreductase [Kribbella capetownensis]TCC44516.1 NAD(P)/FAD-dependent oxidoreductase [Kribbella capetownensis]
MTLPRVVIIGAGFAGFHAAKTLCRLAKGRAEVVVINPTDYFLYVPLLPEVATGILEPRHITVSIADALPDVRLVLGEVEGLDLDRRTVQYADPLDRRDEIEYDRLIIAAGSVNKLLPIPGVTEYAHGFRGIPEAVFLRDHLTQQIELADATDDVAARDALCTFVVVGAGYTGTEVAAHGVLYTELLKKRRPRLRDQRMRWMLLDIAGRVLPELDERLSRTADRVLRERGVEVLMGTSVEEAMHDGVRLTDQSEVPTHSLIWCVGVRPDPVVEALGLKTEKGRLLVDEYLNVPDRPEVFACGDAAAVPDLTRPGEVTPMTAQHAERQGRRAAKNVAASFGTGERKPYVHKDLGFVVDLGGKQAAANPLQVPLAGLPAKAVTRGYHLISMPGNRVRTATEWLFDATLHRQTTQLGVIPAADVPLETASPERVRPH